MYEFTDTRTLPCIKPVIEGRFLILLLRYFTASFVYEYNIGPSATRGKYCYFHHNIVASPFKCAKFQTRIQWNIHARSSVHGMGRWYREKHVIIAISLMCAQFGVVRCESVIRYRVGTLCTYMRQSKMDALHGDMIKIMESNTID